MPAAIAVRRMTFFAAAVGLLALAASAPAAPSPSTGGVSASPASTTSSTTTTAAPAPAPSSASSASALPGPGAVQQALHIPVTHRWDHRTRQAVRAFQRRHGLTVDGIVGPRTAAALGLASTASGASATHVSAELQKIAQCESGGDPTVVSKDGRYRGKYQFTRATWRRLGGHGDPAQAPEAEQDRLAAALLALDGPSAWPTCG